MYKVVHAEVLMATLTPCTRCAMRSGRHLALCMTHINHS